MELMIVSKEFIKPSRPTPLHLNTYELSAMDQLSPSVYIPILFFYSNPNAPSVDTAKISTKLKESLSQTLNFYYPLAGRMRRSSLIDCTDEGVSFSEAKVRNTLVGFLRSHGESGQRADLLFHDNLQWERMDNSEIKGLLLAVSLSIFSCGGFAIGICISHKFGDASTIFTFVNDWAAMATDSNEEEAAVRPAQLISASIFPPDARSIVPETEIQTGGELRTRRFVFTPTAIANLKSDVLRNNLVQVRDPTRVEVVTALIFKCASSVFPHKSSLLAQTVNIRDRMAVLLPEKSIGNVVWFFPVMTRDEKDRNLGNLVCQMRESLLLLCESMKKIIDGKQWVSMAFEASSRSRHIRDNELECFKCSSWCGLPAYKADFGWGKPMWVSGSFWSPLENNIILIDAKDGQGIEAWVTLKKETMANLEAHSEFLKFASL